MSLRGYTKKSKPALWATIHPPRQREQRTKRVRAVSKRRQKVTAEYRRDARAFVKECNRLGMTCPVVDTIYELRTGKRYGHPISNKITEVHHQFGRLGGLLMWKPGWIGISKEGHRWVHAHPKEAREHGWIAPNGMWNNINAIQQTIEFLLTPEAKELY